jgi:O-acetyl-ADP-ribose deacetylase (regulator of RNase III)/protein-tyrosine phosphatase
MRILPLALVGRDWSTATLIEKAHLASRVTHGHPRCQVACAVYCVALAGLLAGQEPAAALAWAFAENERAYVENRGRGLEPHLAALEELRTWTARGGSGFVVDAFWSAWDAFAGATDYADAIRRAVAYGHDTDTTAAIAGGLAGAYGGWEEIPIEWRRGMRGRDIAQPLVDGLVGTITSPERVRTSTASPLRVDELDLHGTSLQGSGRAGITFLPGKKHDGWTGPHWRDLDLDLARLRDRGVDALFLLVEDSELDMCRVPELPEVMAADGPELIRFPIRDPRTPTDDAAYRAAVVDLFERIRGGQFVAIACRGGVDRSGMTAACLYRELGLDFDEAIRRTQSARKGSITILEQQAVVRAWPQRRAGLASMGGGGHAGTRPLHEREIAPGRVLAVVEGDITRVAADAIVNAANNAFAHGGGVDGAIRRAAGPELSGEMRRRYPAGTPTGSAVATGAYALPARWVIHAVGPVWGVGGHDKLSLLASAYRGALVVADELGARTICAPAISAGTFGFPIEVAADVALRTVRDYLLGETGIERVTFVLRPSAVEVFRRRLAAI